MAGERRYPGETAGILTPQDFDRTLLWADENGASDIKVAPGRPVWARFDGEWYLVTRRALQLEEVKGLVNHTTRGHAALGHLSAGGGDYDYHYAIRTGRGEQVRFRANATACDYNAQIGLEITLRVINPLPPSIEDLAMPAELVEACLPYNGLVLITGKMGSGKSTTLAALLRHCLETSPRSVATYESPIEYDLSKVKGNIGPLAQSEIPREFPDFTRAARNSARRASDIILIGESRDPETMRSAMESAEIGSAVYSTVHAAGVAETATRIINMFERSERVQISATMFSALRLILHQRLVAKPGGGRSVIREWLAFTLEMREHLAMQQPEALNKEITIMIREHGRALLDDASEAFEAGRIEEYEWHKIQAERGRERVRA